ncbi:hypothetical protein [Gordonia soli]|uniref:Tetratricopeptide repeat protein n=1 Tax=Gordonia soli NBRC 108243 TaxID=1223545 RepID=M0QNE5_9ACTN|nr:hypothetical protein [Gordonia soli]GAC68942.1 hypothetical protein GS4_20_00070 [Gordonia soli NBRC 108243]
MTDRSRADQVMTAIMEAVTVGRSGDTDSAATSLTDIWTRIGPDGDALHRCTVAHHLADLQDHPADSLVWNVRALDAADSLTDSRVRDHHDDLRVAGFYPSLYLNLADDHRRLGAVETARRHLTQARERLGVLADDDYGRLVQTGVDRVGAAVDAGETGALESDPTR